MALELEQMRASDGSGEAVRALVTILRTPGSTVITPNSLVNWPDEFAATAGPLLPDGTLDPAKTIVFRGHIAGSTIIIDELAPGYTDTYGSSVGDVVVIKPTTWWADTLVEQAIDGVATTAAITAEQILRTDQTTSDFVQSGGVWSGLTGLNAAMTAVTAYIDGYRNTVPAVATRAFTLSRDTYVDILRNTGTNAFSLVYTEVANGAASPALAANSLRLGKVPTNATVVGTIVQTGRDSLDNSIRPTGAISTQNIEDRSVTTSKMNVEYSLSEIPVGTWIDGKTIYRKVINFGALPNATTKAVAHGISGVTQFTNIFIVSRDGFQHAPIPWISLGSLSGGIQANVNGTHVQIFTQNNYTSFSVTYAVLEYVK